MKGRSKLACTAAFAASAILSWTMPASASVVGVSAWDDATLDGWTFVNNSYGHWEIVTSGGNPGGYVRFVDTINGYVADDLHGPSSLQGDYGALTNARFEFDMKSEKAAAVGAWITFSGPGGSYYYVTPVPTTSWGHYVIPLQEASWSRSSGSWSGLLANVTNFSIQGDIVSGCNQAELALDNFALTPEPATILLVALGGLWFARRR